MSTQQGAVAQIIAFQGPGLHTAGNHKIIIHPAAADTGIVFRQYQSGKAIAEIPAHWKYVKHKPLCTCIASGAHGQVRTIEHLMSAFYACGIDNALVEVHGHEIPVMDGSAEPFVRKMLGVGRQEQHQPQKVLAVTKAARFSEGERNIRIEPAGSLYIDIAITLAKIGHLQWQGELNPTVFREEIAAARTFGRLKNGLLAQFTRFSKDPVCLGANTKTALVILGGKSINKARMPDEYIRHRVLDLVGDLMLCGGHIRGKITARSTAHRLNHGLIQKLFENNAIEICS